MRELQSKTSLFERKLALLHLTCLSFIVFLGKAYENSLRGIDSNIHAAVSRSVTAHGFLPQLPIPYVTGDSPFFNDHPFFGFWLNGWVMRALGPSAWSARILTAGFSVGCVLLVYILGSLIKSPFYGFLSALFFLFCRDVILTGATFSLDPAMLFFLLLSFVFWEKGKTYRMGIAAGLGLWFKTPVVLLIFPTAICYSILEGKFKKNIKKIMLAGAVAFIVGSVVWIILAVLGGWTWVFDYWSRQVWGTAIRGRHFNERTDYFMFYHLVKHGYVFGLPFLIGSLFKITLHKKWNDPVVKKAVVPILILVAIISPIRFKYGWYFNPTFPFLSFLTAYGIWEYLQKFELKIYRGLTIFTPLVAAFLVCCPIPLGPEAFLALKRFEPLIQSYGSPTDTVFYVSGGEPVGSAVDYRAHLIFYTGRQFRQIECSQVSKQIRSDTGLAWLILAQTHMNNCLTQSEREQFTQIFKVGNQYLLTNQIPKTESIDLTPLEKEYQAYQD